MCVFYLLLCDQKYIMYALCNNYIYTYTIYVTGWCGMGAPPLFMYGVLKT